MRNLVIAFALLLMVAGTTVGILKTLKIGPFAEPPADAAKVEEKAPPAVVEPPRFVDMEPLTINIFQADQVVASIQIQLKLETHGSKNEATLARMMPKLSDAFFKDLHGFLPRMLEKDEKIDVPALRRRLQSVADRVGEQLTGQRMVDNVVVQSVQDKVSR